MKFTLFNEYKIVLEKKSSPERSVLAVNQALIPRNWSGDYQDCLLGAGFLNITS